MIKKGPPIVNQDIPEEETQNKEKISENNNVENKDVEINKDVEMK